LINFFSVNRQLGFVDLPGYGFAQVSRTERATWGPMVERLFRTRQELAGVVHILDVRHRPSTEDQDMRTWLLQWNLPVLLVATKVDKIGRTQRHTHLKEIREALNLQEDPLVVFSAQTGEGREKIWEWIRQVAGL
jgi:GTP-binding protein